MIKLQNYPCFRMRKRFHILFLTAAFTIISQYSSANEQFPLQTINDYKFYVENAALSDPQALAAISSMHTTGNIFPSSTYNGLRFAILAKSFGWDYEPDYWNYIVSNNISAKKLKKLTKQAENCLSPFDKDCEISKPIIPNFAYISTSDIKLYRFKKGLFLDTLKPQEVMGFYNYEHGILLGLPSIFYHKLTKFFPETKNAGECKIEGRHLDSFLFYNSKTPEGKGEEINKKDYLSFKCSKVLLR